MRFGRLVWWRREVLGLAGGGPGRGLRRRGLARRLRGPVAVLAGVPLLSVSLVAGVSLEAGGAGVAEAASASGAGRVTIYAGLSAPAGITAGPDGNLWFTNNGNNTIGRITTTGTVTIYHRTSIDLPSEITEGPDGAVWFTNRGDGIGRITTAVTPEISGVTPASGAAGTTVTIAGLNLAGATAVAFGGTPAIIVSATATQIVTTVPVGAATGPITVTTPAGTATSHTKFTVT